MKKIDFLNIVEQERGGSKIPKPKKKSLQIRIQRLDRRQDS